MTDADLYQPTFTPYLDDRGEFRRVFDRGSPRAIVSMDRCHILYSLLRQAMHLDGEVWECGVYKGGTAAMFVETLRRWGFFRTVRLFDTFCGLPEADASIDLHGVGDFADTDAEKVRQFIDYDKLTIHRGTIPESLRFGFAGKIAFLHIDLDTYRSTLACLEETWPLVAVGGIVVNDDYGFASCPGARKAVDEFFLGRKCVPLCLSTGQAVIFKGIE